MLKKAVALCLVICMSVSMACTGYAMNATDEVFKEKTVTSEYEQVLGNL